MTAATVAVRLLLALAVSTQPATVTAPALKAAFLFNFAKFATWPAASLTPGQNLTLCVLDDEAITAELHKTVKGHAVDGHVLAVQSVTRTTSIHWCHVLYVGGLEATELTRWPHYTTNAVLTVGSHHRFAEQGGIAQLIQDHDRMRFAINIAAAQRAQLTLSSRLLGLATIIKEAQ